ncbi:MAG: hypothetical protein Q9227_005347 [Pyrenula ochraceoflavens]
MLKSKISFHNIMEGLMVGRSRNSALFNNTVVYAWPQSVIYNKCLTASEARPQLVLRPAMASKQRDYPPARRKTGRLLDQLRRAQTKVIEFKSGWHRPFFTSQKSKRPSNSVDNSSNCTICENPSHFNPKLCNECQNWNDLTHLFHCQHEQYRSTNTDLFSIQAIHKISDEVFAEACADLPPAFLEHVSENFSLHTLEDYADPVRKSCIVCKTIGEAMRDHFDRERLYGSKARVAVWRPFPASIRSIEGPECINNVQYQNGKQAERTPGDPTTDSGALMECVLPIVILTKSAEGQNMSTPSIIELALHYDKPRYGLKKATRWDRTTIDVDTILAWLNDCKNFHDSGCNSKIAAMPLPRSFRLIDTAKWCVTTIPPENPVSYLALSYVWAANSSTALAVSKPFQLERKNVAELQRENALKEAGDVLPKLLVDAIQLCADLGYRYLWVDRLCIVQDEGSHKLDQLNAMDAIYHTADLTIVALGNGSTAGLPGTSSQPRMATLANKCWRLVVDKRDYVGAHLPKLHSAVSQSKWNRRGWTYQERILSRRHLFLEDTHFYLNCFHSYFASEKPYSPIHPERFQAGRGYEKGIRTMFRSSDPEWDSDITRYTSAVQEYTTRELTYDTDILDAFAGVGNVFASQHDTIMLFGLPEKHFFQTMLWHHDKKNICKARHFPAAWAGAVSYGRVRWVFNGQEYAAESDSNYHMGSLVQYYYSDPSSRKLRLVNENRHWFGNELHAEEQEDSGSDDTKTWDTKTAMTMQMWRTCVHCPWKAHINAAITKDGLALALTVPGSLVFNTTVSFLTLRKSTSKPADRTVLGSTRFNIKNQRDFERALGAARAEPGSPASGTSMTPSEAAESIVFDILARDGTQVGQTFPLWDPSDSDEEDDAEHRSAVLERNFKPDQSYAVAVLGASRSNPKVADGTGNPYGLIVMIMDYDERSGLSRRLALGAVNPMAWTQIEPEWKTVVLV